MMKLRVIKQAYPFAVYPIGHVLEAGGGVADIWLRKGIVELVEDEPQLETATIEPDQNAALRTERPKRKRGRPRIRPVKT
jgi:hypothetical protein